jgi:hypothetical protein
MGGHGGGGGGGETYALRGFVSCDPFKTSLKSNIMIEGKLCVYY